MTSIKVEPKNYTAWEDGSSETIVSIKKENISEDEGSEEIPVEITVHLEGDPFFEEPDTKVDEVIKQESKDLSNEGYNTVPALQETSHQTGVSNTGQKPFTGTLTSDQPHPIASSCELVLFEDHLRRLDTSPSPQRSNSLQLVRLEYKGNACRVSVENVKASKDINNCNVKSQCHVTDKSVKKLKNQDNVSTGTTSSESPRFDEKSLSSKSKCTSQNYELRCLGVKPFKCRFCEKSYGHYSECEEHEGTFHDGHIVFVEQDGEQSSHLKHGCNKNESTLGIVKIFPCQFCDLTFSSKFLCIEHLMTHTHDESSSHELGDESYRMEQRVQALELLPPSEKPLNANSVQSHSPPRKRHEKLKCQNTEKMLMQTDDCQKEETTRNDDKPFMCQFCDKRFTRKTYCRDHEAVHTGRKSFTCQFCDESFRKKKDCCEHELIHKKEGHQLRDKSVTMKHDNMQSFMRMQTKRNPFKCQFCTQSFTTMYSCKRHEKVLHGEGKTFKCPCCEEIFMRVYDYQKHKATHADKRAFKCQFCDKRFARVLHHTEHEALHTGEKPFKCQLCGIFFKRKKDCRKHELKHARERHQLKCKSDEMKEKVLTHSRKKPFKCQFCKQLFKSKSNYTKHKKLHEVTPGKMFKCHFCEKSFTSAYNCQKHKSKHLASKLFDCQSCNKKFKTKYAYLEHEATHTGEKPFQCQFCNRCFARNRNCHKHELLMHIRERPHKCQFCEKTFISKNSHERHENVHKREKHFTCQFCEKSFVQDKDHQKHELSHTAERPFSCQFCKKGFLMKHHCKKHECTHIGGKPFKCQFCCKSYIRKTECVRHEQVHAKERKMQISVLWEPFKS